MKSNIFKLHILDTQYKSFNRKTICIIHYINPISGNVCSSKGIAKCSPEDNNKLLIGQRIAEGRAKRNMYIKYCNEIHKAYLQITYKHDILAKRETEHLKNIIDSL